MNKVCPLCKGAKTIPAANGTQGDEHQPCQVCGGEGHGRVRWILRACNWASYANGWDISRKSETIYLRPACLIWR